MLIRGRSPTIGSRIFKLLSRRNTSSQRRFNAGPTSTTLNQRQTNAAPTHCVRWVGFHPNELDANTIKPPSTQRRASVVDGGPTSTPRQTRHTEPMLVQCWASVAYGGPTLTQHRPNVSRLPEQQRLMHRVGRIASADRMMAVSQHQANTGFSTKYTTLLFHMTIHING